MNSGMSFPDTVEEYMNQYKMTDTDKVYSNGTEYVPIFRMRQWFDHVEEQKYDEWCPGCKEYDQKRHCCPRWNRVIRETLNDMPERKTGKWIWQGFNIECSECGAMPDFDSTEPLYRFCPNCGADMRGEQNERIN